MLKQILKQIHNLLSKVHASLAELLLVAFFEALELSQGQATFPHLRVSMLTTYATGLRYSLATPDVQFPK